MSHPDKPTPSGHLLQTIMGIIEFADSHAGHAITQQLLRDITKECIQRADHRSRRAILGHALTGCAATATTTPDPSTP